MKKILSFLICIALLLSLVSCGKSSISTEGDLIVHFIDVGQGDCSFIEFPDNTVMLIDSGEEEYANTVASYIKNLGYEKIDYLVATHPHSDHMGSMYLIVKNFNIGSIYMPDATNTSSVFEKLLEQIDSKGLTVNTTKAGMQIKESKENKLIVKTLAPCSDEYDDLNNYSIVIKITYNMISYLFMGDAETKSEKEITDDVSADVIKVGHHGSNTSSSRNFVEQVMPKIAVFSVGEDNGYDHPSFDVVKRFESVGASIYRTDKLGTIVVSTNGIDLFVNNEDGSETYTNLDSPTATTVQLFEHTYILNISSKKIHSTDCASVKTIKDENREESHLSIDELENQGYKKCSICNAE